MIINPNFIELCRTYLLETQEEDNWEVLRQKRFKLEQDLFTYESSDFDKARELVKKFRGKKSKSYESSMDWIARTERRNDVLDYGSILKVILKQLVYHNSNKWDEIREEVDKQYPDKLKVELLQELFGKIADIPMDRVNKGEFLAYLIDEEVLPEDDLRSLGALL